MYKHMPLGLTIQITYIELINLGVLKLKYNYPKNWSFTCLHALRAIVSAAGIPEPAQ
jgi:hypothetical protein